MGPGAKPAQPVQGFKLAVGFKWALHLDLPNLPAMSSSICLSETQIESLLVLHRPVRKTVQRSIQIAQHIGFKLCTIYQQMAFARPA